MKRLIVALAAFAALSLPVSATEIRVTVEEIDTSYTSLYVKVFSTGTHPCSGGTSGAYSIYEVSHSLPNYDDIFAALQINLVHGKPLNLKVEDCNTTGNYARVTRARIFRQ